MGRQRRRRRQQQKAIEIRKNKTRETLEFHFGLFPSTTPQPQLTATATRMRRHLPVCVNVMCCWTFRVYKIHILESRERERKIRVYYNQPAIRVSTLFLIPIRLTSFGDLCVCYLTWIAISFSIYKLSTSSMECAMRNWIELYDYE